MSSSSVVPSWIHSCKNPMLIYFGVRSKIEDKEQAVKELNTMIHDIAKYLIVQMITYGDREIPKTNISVKLCDVEVSMSREKLFYFILIHRALAVSRFLHENCTTGRYKANLLYEDPTPLFIISVMIHGAQVLNNKQFVREVNNMVKEYLYQSRPDIDKRYLSIIHDKFLKEGNADKVINDCMGLLATGVGDMFDLMTSGGMNKDSDIMDYVRKDIAKFKAEHPDFDTF